MGLPLAYGSEKPADLETAATRPDDITASSESGPAAGSAGGQLGDGLGGGSGRSEVEIAADRLYEERMEDEYAKREGGA